MTESYVLALDAGTTSTRAIVFDRSGNILSLGQQEFTQIYPHPGWVEHDPREIWTAQLKVIREALAAVPVERIAGIGITNQRETAVVWDRRTGAPIHNAIVWQDRRTAGVCDSLRARGLEPYVAEATGLVIDAYFSATKIQWILDHVPDARARAETGDLAFGTIDSWLIWNLTGGKVHVTDYSNASRTLLFNIGSLTWDSRLLDELGIPRAILPEVRNSSEIYGRTSPELFGVSLPVAAAAGDQQAALFGHACFTRGAAKCTYGTAADLMMNTGAERVKPGLGMVSTIAAGLDGKVDYAVEGVLFFCGAAVQWLRDELKIISKSAEAVVTTEDTHGVYFVPALTGLSAPTWDPYARGLIIGLTRSANREHLIRATLESMAYQVRDVVDAMRTLSGIAIDALKVDGGATNNDFVMQFQADLLGIPVLRPRVVEVAARGAAFLAGLATGVWNDREELADTFELQRKFLPQMDRAKADRLYVGWTRAVERSRGWIAPGEEW
ncbi:MAG TPA: glycerol kinase GlpK [Bauldia sp.]|nr:glycerol kinase GlpK [Bauldia sp.]